MDDKQIIKAVGNCKHEWQKKKKRFLLFNGPWNCDCM